MTRKTLLTLFLAVCLSGTGLLASSIEVTDEYDFSLALDYAWTANIDTLILTTPGGIYATADTFSLTIREPITLIAGPGLASPPVITHNATDKNIIHLMRACNSLTAVGLVFDGRAGLSLGQKNAVVVTESEIFPDGFYMPATEGADITFIDCIFQNFGDPEDPEGDQEGHAIYFYKDIGTMGTVRFENCRFYDIGDEAIRMTETEKYAVERCLDSLIVRNCTFTGGGSECIRFYADTDTSTTDAYILLENITIDASATRTCYIKNNRGTILRNWIISNSIPARPYRAERNDFLIQIQELGSSISNLDTFNITTLNGTSANPIYVSKNNGEGTDTTSIWGFDPQYADGGNRDWNLAAGSHAYYSSHDGSVLGDQVWGSATPTVIPFFATVTGEGVLEYDPVKQGNCFDPGTSVTITAVPAEGYAFAGWSGDLSGTDNPVSLTVAAEVNISALFQVATSVDEPLLAKRFSLEQNYPNPFNPVTSIAFSLARNTAVRLVVYDVLGQEVHVLRNRFMTAGDHQVSFDASTLPSGMYFYRLETDDFSSTAKMMLVK